MPTSKEINTNPLGIGLRPSIMLPKINSIDCQITHLPTQNWYKWQIQNVIAGDIVLKSTEFTH